MTMKNIYSQLLFLSVGLLGLYSCSDADLEPSLEQDKTLNENLVSISDIETYLNGTYSLLKNVNYYGRDYQIYGEVRSDNTYANGNSGRFVVESQMNYTPSVGNMPSTWYRIYQVVGRANLLINKYEGVGGWLPFQGDANRIKYYAGVAYTLRAMAHFDLVRIFGQHYINGEGGMNALGIPYVEIYRGDPNNPTPARNTVQEVYDKAMEDVDRAISLMDSSLDSRQSYYVNSYTPKALKSRMAIYFKDYAVAKTVSKEIIDSGRFSIISKDDFVSSWGPAQSSSNWIFSLYANTSNERLGINGLAYIYRQPPSGGGYGDIVGLGNLYNIFETTDIRISSSMVSEVTEIKPATATKTADEGIFRNMGKFPDVTTGGDPIPLFRYEEIILNYAEALVNTNEATEALTYLNLIPQNRGASPYTVANMDNILLERRKEFAFEGHRFHDLVRTGKGVPYVDQTRQRFGTEVTAGSPRLAFPIPNTEIGANANMKQNKGY